MQEVVRTVIDDSDLEAAVLDISALALGISGISIRSVVDNYSLG